ncbi:MAG: SGNH/GDSL hydrolase family protein [Oceanospirillaceae bacterium]|nr:SGNH/GDSL hydrolase family protein [Oceanospirillaceae bacterium]
MPTIVCFGDSNTWGSVPNKLRRYNISERWPALLRAALPHDFEVIEEGQPGRTTVHDDPFEGEKNGLRYLKPCLESHVPDLVLIMLGTNDLKHRFGLSAYDIAQGAAKLAQEVLVFNSMAKKSPPKVLLIAPPPVYEVGFFADMFEDAALKSQQLAKHYAQFSKALGCSFFDAGSVVSSCKREGIHWPVEQHKLLANALTPIVENMFSQ